MTKKYIKLSQILKKILFDRNMRPADLAREIDMPIPTIHRIVTGKSTRPYPGSLQAIAKYLGVTINQLTGEEPLFQDIDKLPVSKDARAILIIDWSQISNHYASNQQLKQTSELVVINVSEDAFALIMPDYSMEPLFQKNSILIFDPKAVANDRDYVLVKLHNPESYIFRQLLIDGTNRFIKPLNSEISFAGVKLLEPEDLIIARLVEVRNKL